jgi:hypothetical protein
MQQIHGVACDCGRSHVLFDVPVAGAGAEQNVGRTVYCDFVVKEGSEIEEKFKILGIGSMLKTNLDDALGSVSARQRL